ncbi:hypothetical protein BHE74_00014433 [Ensete ventricosum]|nr:hypothetical protein BHE74_00014433 [Ensete ventricosum]
MGMRVGSNGDAANIGGEEGVGGNSEGCSRGKQRRRCYALVGKKERATAMRAATGEEEGGSNPASESRAKEGEKYGGRQLGREAAMERSISRGVGHWGLGGRCGYVKMAAGKREMATRQ